MTVASPTSSTPVGWVVAWRERAALLLRSLGFWTVWFAGARALFYAWHWAVIPAAERGDVLRSFGYGARMDLSAAAYLTAVQWLILTLAVALAPTVTRRLLRGFAAFVIVFVALVVCTDIGTFGPWRRRLDASIWTYLATPREAYASAESIALGPLLGVLGLVILATWWGYRRVMRAPEQRLQRPRGVQAVAAGLATFFTGLLLAIPIRGGVQWTPINESTVFFSQSEMANSGALNAPWYLLSTTLAQQKVPTDNPYRVLSASDATAIVDSLFQHANDAPQNLLRVSRPNVILIIWESFTAKVVARLGGRPKVTPQFDRWTHQGVLFDSLFASGERSAQGLVSILSGFPSVPNEAIMTRSQKGRRPAATGAGDAT